VNAEWDEKKRLSNLAKHNVDFNRVASIFDGRVVAWPLRQRGYGEDRFAALGIVKEMIFYVVYTWRGDLRRIISARKAGRRERERYHKSVIERSS
jgi:uncharacterized DUF497 family protein